MVLASKSKKFIQLHSKGSVRMVINKNAMLCSILAIVLALLLLTTQSAHAAPIDKFPVTVTQPDGTILHLFVSGDEYYNWLHDENGYTIIQDPVTGYYVYANLVNGELVPTPFVVGKADLSLTGLSPYLNISPEQKEASRRESLEQLSAATVSRQSTPAMGTINNLVIFIRFSDESEFTDPATKYIDMLNNSAGGASSLRNYYQEVSYNALTINSTILPAPGATIVSYQDAHPRSYYQPYNAVTNPGGYNSDRMTREQTLVRDAINYVASLGQFPSGASIDSDGDGIVDSLTLIVSGSPDGWSELLWPHMGNLYTYRVTVNGKTVYPYILHVNSNLNTGSLAHEMFHVLGAPDLYHYEGSLQPVGQWDIMGYSENPPQHMSCYMKFKYGGWINGIPEVTAPGTYTLNPLTSPTNNCLKIASPYSATEYFVVEYRNQTSSLFESELVGTGLLVYRINTTLNGNSMGPPDEVYLYRPGGTTSANGNWMDAAFSSDVGRTAINDRTDPASFLTNGSAGGLNLCNIGPSGSTISFDICTSQMYSISGNVGVINAPLSYILDGLLRTVRADEWGRYTFTVPSGWSGTVTPSNPSYTNPGYTFSPVSRSYTNVIASQAAQDYIATVSDIYESDNTSNEAKAIEAYTPHFHSLIPAGDVDWIKFTLNTTSAVTLETHGVTLGASNTDTEMWLYDSNHNELKYSDNEGWDSYSYINLKCGVDALPAGEYYAKVSEFGNDNEIPSYEIYLSTKACQFATLTIKKAGTGSGTVVGTTAVGNNIYCGTDCSRAYEYNTRVSLLAGADAGSDFVGWSGDADCLDGVVTLTKDISCTAMFTYHGYRLFINKAGTGSGVVTATGINCGTDCSEAYAYNTEVTLTASPAAGSIFAGWSGSAYCSDGVMTMIADRSCTAIFNLQPLTPTPLTPTGTATIGYTPTVTPSPTATYTPTATQTPTPTTTATPMVNYDRDTTGVFRPSNGLLYLKNKNESGFADAALNYGLPGDYPVVGDWDGNGTVTIGIYRKGYFYLKNSNTLGFAEVVFPFGISGDQPIAGDWNGDGTDTIGIFRPFTGQFQLRNDNSEGPVDTRFYLGNVGDVGIAGDWDNDGIDTTGVFRPSNGIIFLKNKNEDGFADIALNYGLPGDMPVTGDWDNDGIDTIGVYRQGQFMLRNENTIGFAEVIFGLGNPGDMPIAGNWDGLP
jgi:M6 family metalloprotease-like protein